MLPDQCSVLRNGNPKTIEGTTIVPGDIIYISMGNKLPADVRFIEVSSDARFDRSILTGEAARFLLPPSLLIRTTSRLLALVWLELTALLAALLV